MRDYTAKLVTYVSYCTSSSATIAQKADVCPGEAAQKEGFPGFKAIMARRGHELCLFSFHLVSLHLNGI